MKISKPRKSQTNDFNPFPYQKELIDKILSGKNVILKSSRQMGCTTTLFYCAIEMCLKNPGTKVLIVRPNPYSFVDCPFFDDIKLKRRTKYSIEFQNGSLIEILPGSSLRGRNFSEYHIFFDLYEFISESLRNELFTSFRAKPNIRFYSFTGLNDFTREGFEEMIWYRHYRPEFNSEEWKNYQISILGINAYNKEFIEQ